MSLDTYISERHMVKKYQSLVEEKVGKFRSKSDTTIESWVQGIATNSATGHSQQMVEYWQSDSITYLA